MKSHNKRVTEDFVNVEPASALIIMDHLCFNSTQTLFYFIVAFCLNSNVSGSSWSQ